jgi:hypothetical protein
VADQRCIILYPGVASPLSCTYTCSHGISPGVAVLSCLPQDISAIALQGDLVLSDGVNTLTVPACQLAQVRATWDERGQTWHLQLYDRRWRWRECGVVTGLYNVPDSSGDVTRPEPTAGPVLRAKTQYIPWTFRTPHQLIALLLRAMGETRFQIAIPNVANPAPYASWDYTNPAQALSQLCQQLGAAIVYRLDTDSVLIAPVGEGAALPDDGSIYLDGPSLKAPSRPDQIVCVGAPLRIQARFFLQAVGEEWDGSVRPIAELSYRPAKRSARQVSSVTPIAVDQVGDVFSVTITTQDQQTITASYTAAATTVADVTAGLTAAINAKQFAVTAKDGSDHVELDGDVQGNDFVVTATANGNSQVQTSLDIQPDKPDNPWHYSGAPDFALVQATARLTYLEAREKAQNSVFKMYRLLLVDPTSRRPPLKLPGYSGRIDRIQQILLQSTQIEQVQPPKADELVRGADGQLLANDFFNGNFRERPAKCYGAHQQATIFLKRQNAIDANSANDAEVLVPFLVDADRQMIVFQDYVYYYTGSGQKPADLYLQTACQVRDADTNQIVRGTWTFTLPGPKYGTPPAVIHQEDVEYLIVGQYSTSGSGFATLDKTITNDKEAAARAQYYLANAAAKYELVGVQERAWNGLVPVWCDGAIQQVTWSIDESGVSTHASRNSEHNLYVPSLPERLRLEYITAVKNQGNPNVVGPFQLGRPK